MIACCFIGVKGKGSAQASYTLVILSDLSWNAFSEAYLEIHMCRQISCHHHFLTNLNLCHGSNGWRNKFHCGLIVWLCYEIDLGELINSILCLDLGIARHGESKVLREHQTFWIRIYVVQLIILVVKSNINGSIEILSTNESLRPICVVVHDFKLCGKWSTIWAIACFVLIVSIILYTKWLNTVKVNCSAGNSS